MNSYDEYHVIGWLIWCGFLKILMNFEHPRNECDENFSCEWNQFDYFLNGVPVEFEIGDMYIGVSL